MVIFTGASVEEAIQNGLKTLDIPRMRAHITVVSREKKGFLGLFGKKPAQVDVEPSAETTVAKANQQAVKLGPEEIQKKSRLKFLKTIKTPVPFWKKQVQLIS